MWLSFWDAPISAASFLQQADLGNLVAGENEFTDQVHEPVEQTDLDAQAAFQPRHPSHVFLADHRLFRLNFIAVPRLL